MSMISGITPPLYTPRSLCLRYTASSSASPPMPSKMWRGSTAVLSRSLQTLPDSVMISAVMYSSTAARKIAAEPSTTMPDMSVANAPACATGNCRLAHCASNISPGMSKGLKLTPNLSTALYPSSSTCFASSPVRTSRTAISIRSTLMQSPVVLASPHRTSFSACAFASCGEASHSARPARSAGDVSSLPDAQRMLSLGPTRYCLQPMRVRSPRMRSSTTPPCAASGGWLGTPRCLP
mmetsp:Transcript_42835/g.97424  ORF Transcript_42835/g.97424 Transcript_42835/m.97424 type:complete len:237 (-) Transcript_42835:442-1152(-)